MTISIGSDRYEATIRRTTHGVAHISGASVPDVVFGQGYGCAQDHLPTIADQLLKTRSERSLHFGRGEGDCHLNSDFGYRAMGIDQWATNMAETQPAEIVEVVHAYAAGINAWLRDHGTESLPEWCRSASWIRSVDALDLFRLYADFALMASGRNLAQFIGAARPPGATDVVSPSGPLVPPDLPGSNGWALGRAAVANGRGAVVANPHFPWYGDGRFWECHLTVPGELDVYGASLVGAPTVHIGFNRDVAWTHTFSAGSRFVIYRLDLGEGDPTSYRFGEDHRAMTSQVASVELLTEPGQTETVSRTLWSSHHGPMVDIPLLGWSEGMGFAVGDLNVGNDRFLSQYLAMDRADSVGGLRAAVHEHQGLPWVNVIAADRHGDVWYSDPSPVPNLSPEVSDAFDHDVDHDPLTSLFYSQRVALLDGSDPATGWIVDPAARQPGAVPVSGLPELHTDTVAFNSNDPYWVPHPELRLDRGPVLAGLYGRPLSPRTRMNATVLAGRAPTRPTGPGGKWTLDDLQAALLDNRSLHAEELLAGVIERCRRAGSVGRSMDHDGEYLDESIDDSATVDQPVDLVAVADLLSNWNRTFDLDAVGAVVWREFLGGFSVTELRNQGPLYAEPFDPERPTVTPNGLATHDGDPGSDPVVKRMLAGLRVLQQAGVPFDAPLGSVQYVDRGGERIGLHGANEVEGIVNVVAPYGAFQRSDLEPAVVTGDPIPGRSEVTGLRHGGYPITYGASIILVVGFDDDGPTGRGLLTYGQSGDASSVHHVDQMRDFAAKRLRPLLFHDSDIAADPNLTTRIVTN